MTQDEKALPQAIARIQEHLSSEADPSDEPQQFVRLLHQAWKQAGGTLSGKPRHSDRFLADQLKDQGLEVRSLTPKLVGKTRIASKDAETLVRYFLENWPDKADAGSNGDDDVTYKSFLSKKVLDDVVDFVSNHIAARSASSSSFETAAAAPLPSDEFPGEAVGPLIDRMFQESDAYFIVGTERPLVTADTKTELLGFRNLMNRLKEIEYTDRKIRPLVWVLDMGRQIFEENDVESRQRFLGVQALITRFKALRLFEDRGREERWAWLSKRAAFVILDTRFDEPFEMKGFKRPAFVAHHVALSAIAPEWAKDPNFRALYGSDMQRLDQRNFSVFYNAEGWPAPTEDNEDAVIWRRYFGYASFARNQLPNADKVARGLELPSPGRSYEDAYRAVYRAAIDLLKIENRSLSDYHDSKIVIAQLRYLGFRLMNLQDFMKL